jgi:hypothetical protein
MGFLYFNCIDSSIGHVALGFFLQVIILHCLCNKFEKRRFDIHTYRIDVQSSFEKIKLIVLSICYLTGLNKWHWSQPLRMGDLFLKK